MAASTITKLTADDLDIILWGVNEYIITSKGNESDKALDLYHRIKEQVNDN